MYKENVKITTFDYEKIKVNAETHAVARNRAANFYFDCSKCEKQSISDDSGTPWACNNYCQTVELAITRSGKNKIYCTNYKRVKNG